MTHSIIAIKRFFKKQEEQLALLGIKGYSMSTDK